MQSHHYIVHVFRVDTVKQTDIMFTDDANCYWDAYSKVNHEIKRMQPYFLLASVITSDGSVKGQYIRIVNFT